MGAILSGSGIVLETLTACKTLRVANSTSGRWRDASTARTGGDSAAPAIMPAPFCYHAVMAKQLTIRGVSDEVGQRLEGLSRARGKSVNTVVLEILEGAVGVNERRNRLARYMTWTPDDLVEFNDALAAQRTIDDPLWS